jgi:DNA-directed RNA polymerase subunit alpha
MNLISTNTFPIKTSFKTISDTKSSVSIYPLNSGFGQTIGNALRRVLISSVPGYAVTKIKVNNFTHEYQSVEGIVEDLQDIILNLKDLIVKVDTSDEIVNLQITKNSAGVVTAKDFKKQAGVTVVNPDLHICTVNNKVDLNIEVEVKKGFGFYQVPDSELSGSTSLSDLYVDAYYSPVKNVSFDVEKYRVGSNTDLDKIIITYETTGAIDPKEAMEYALEILVDQYSKTLSAFKSVSTETTAVDEQDEADTTVSTSKKAKPAVTKVVGSEPVETLGLTKATAKILTIAEINNTDDIVANKTKVEEIISTLKSKGDKEILASILS